MYTCFFFKIPTTKNLTALKAFKTKKNCTLLLKNVNSISETLHNPEKVLFDFSSHELSIDEKRSIFFIPPKRLDYADRVNFRIII